MRSIRWFLALAICLAGGYALYRGVATGPLAVPMAKVRLSELTSTVVTNGQVEPAEGGEARADKGGRVAEVFTVQGQRVAAGAPILRIEDAQAHIELQDAKAALIAAEARLRQTRSGGDPLRRKQLEGSVQEAALTLRHAQEEAAKVRRLQDADAATPRELEVEERRVAVARERVANAEAQVDAMLSDADREDARAAVAAAQARVESATRIANGSNVRSPASGTLYEFAVKVGAWLQPGDLIGRVGSLENLRILVFVDEPELGRVREGLSVTIRWDALPEKQWMGVVDQLPTRIQAFGTRQVGEVVCLIANPDGNLLPGANVNAEIVSAQVKSALVLPKQAIRRRLGEEGVWKLSGASIRWQTVRVGISSITEAQILHGLAEGDSVALLAEHELRDGLEVQPLYP